MRLGTGKSVLLREIIKTLRKKYVKSHDAVAVTASTGIYTLLLLWETDIRIPIGIAACNIGGVTIHSFAGIGLGVENVDKLVEKIRTNRKASSRWRRTQVLIIDEGWCVTFAHTVCDSSSSLDGRRRTLRQAC